MGISDKFIAGLNKIMDRAGNQIRIRYYYQTVGSVWDDDVSLSISGTLWTSGVIFPINSKEGSEDANLISQGLIGTNDKKIYVNGSLNFLSSVGSITDIKLSIGSPINASYSVIWGGIPYEVQGTDIYKKLYLRKLQTGSLIGE